MTDRRQETWPSSNSKALWGVLAIFGYYLIINLVSIIGVAISHIQNSNGLNMTAIIHSQAIGEIIGIMVIFGIFIWNEMSFFNLEELKKGRFWITGLLGGLIILNGNIILSNLAIWLKPEFNTANQETLELLMRSMSPFLQIWSIGIIAPVMEELLFRGVVMRYLLPHNQILGLSLSTIFFALIHQPTDLISFIIYAWLGFVLAYSYHYSKRIELPIVIHMINNLFSLAVS